jgi:hypothetical protein
MESNSSKNKTHGLAALALSNSSRTYDLVSLQITRYSEDIASVGDDGGTE